MRAECQIILIHLLHLIYHKSPEISLSLITPRFLHNRPPIAPQSAVAVLSKLFLESEAENLRPTSKIAYTDTAPF